MARATALVRTGLLATVLLAALPCGRASGADAQQEPPVPMWSEGEVESHVAMGHRLFRLGRYDEAVAEFRRAYELRAEARFLYLIAECYRELGGKDQALFYYQRYLAGMPQAPNRDEVEAKIVEIEGPRARAVAPRPRLLLEAPVEPTAKPAGPPPPWKRWWFWTAIGVTIGGAVAAAALSGGDGATAPITELGSRRFF